MIKTFVLVKWSLHRWIDFKIKSFSEHGTTLFWCGPGKNIPVMHFRADVCLYKSKDCSCTKIGEYNLECWWPKYGFVTLDAYNIYWPFKNALVHPAYNNLGMPLVPVKGRKSARYGVLWSVECCLYTELVHDAFISTGERSDVSHSSRLSRGTRGICTDPFQFFMNLCFSCQ